ncbi:DUF2770 family protein [Budvicia aquatica]|uniref:DUF2770 domain-containing protein n=1 Tax=Budvicia aquatica TaxID=82979 RepID=A0A2C6DQI0_9GAMM|nr:DUF2770 family protein [Budvicia aquatica]PHI30695.1 DUF2770 domain-containing protein [Budvicia aquatica]GKX49817.1 hypothetical protein SOASR029_01260 [Budvicia aquatica]
MNKKNPFARVFDMVVHNVRQHLMIYIVIWLIVLALDIFYIWYY